METRLAPKSQTNQRLALVSSRTVTYHTAGTMQVLKHETSTTEEAAGFVRVAHALEPGGGLQAGLLAPGCRPRPPEPPGWARAAGTSASGSPRELSQTWISGRPRLQAHTPCNCRPQGGRCHEETPRRPWPAAHPPGLAHGR